MTDLERHIVQLLLSNDCVIVPGFGGFMAHRMAASYNMENKIFLPPSRTIGFNPRLTMNDSLLAQSYVNCYDISYPEALTRIEHDVDELKRLIETEHTHTICGIGRISLQDDGKYDFTPEGSGIVTPYLYGFAAYELDILDNAAEDATAGSECEDAIECDDAKPQPLTSEIFTTGKPVTPIKASEPARTDNKANINEIAVRIPMRIVKHIAAACIMLFVLLSFPSRLGDASTSALKQGGIDTSLLYEIMPKDITSGKPDSLNAIQGCIGGNGEAGSFEKKSTDSISDGMAERYYSIVLASRITQKNAERYVEKLHKVGLTDAAIHTNKGMTMVTYKRFKKRADANNVMRVLAGKGEFADCWITEIEQ